MPIIGSFRVKLLKFALGMTLISILLIAIYGFRYFRQRDEINDVIDKINKLNINLIMDIKSQTDFIKYDAIDTNFHLKRTSANLEMHIRLSKNIDEILSSFKRDDLSTRLEIKTELDSLIKLINDIDNEFDRIVIYIQARGFKNSGIEGNMRKYAHLLENTEANSIILLTLRRHEKDYIIRKETQYIDKFNNQIEVFRKYLNTHNVSGNTKKDSIINILNNYCFEFNKLVNLEERIGLYKDNGIIQNLEHHFEASVNVMEDINSKAYIEKTSMFRKLEVNTVLFFLALVLTNILISIILSKYITDPLKKLTAYITKVPENIQNPSKLPDFENSDNEISVLVREFKNMLTQLQTRERERDSAEKALRENETRYRNLSDMLPQGVFETDSDGILTYFNKTLASTLYFDESDTQRQIKITDILNADYEALMDHDYTYGLDYIASKHNGERFPVILYVSKIIKDNFITGLRCIMVDSRGIEPLLSDHRGKKLKSERSDNLKSEFLAN